MEQPIIGKIEQLTHFQPAFTIPSCGVHRSKCASTTLKNEVKILESKNKETSIAQDTKVNALSKRIIEECKKQDFKVGELELLIDSLSIFLEQRVHRFKHELL